MILFFVLTRVTNEGRKGIWISLKCHVTAAVPDGNCTWNDGSPLVWSHSSFIRPLYSGTDFDVCYKIKSENDPIFWFLESDCRDGYTVCEGRIHSL